jgi:hypothetical protein
VNARAYTVGSDVVFGEGQTGDGRLLVHELAHVVQQGRTWPSPPTVVRRQVDPRSPHVRFRRPSVVTSSAGEAKSRFAGIRNGIRDYADNSLDHLSLGYLTGIEMFRLWYAEQERADASLVNAVVNVVMSTAWAWGSQPVGAIAAPVGTIIMLVAQEAARAIQSSRDDFAAGLVKSKLVFQNGLQQRLSGRVPEVIESERPDLWEEIQRRAYLGEAWQPLLARAGVPERRADHARRLLADLIFAYREWELKQHTLAYRGAYSMTDPYLEHMRGRAEAESYLEFGREVPSSLRSYVRKGEHPE